MRSRPAQEAATRLSVARQFLRTVSAAREGGTPLVLQTVAPTALLWPGAHARPAFAPGWSEVLWVLVVVVMKGGERGVGGGGHEGRRCMAERRSSGCFWYCYCLCFHP